MMYFLKSFILVLFLTVASVQAQSSTIKGSLYGYDNKPMKMAHVSVRNFNYQKTFLSQEVSSDGQFVLSLDKEGFFFLVFSGVDHESIEIPFFNETTKIINIDIKLKLNEYEKSFEDLSVIGDFNNFSFSEPYDMEKQKNGTYALQTDYKSDTLRYQLLGVVAGRSVNGTAADFYEFDKESDYRSVIVKKNGKHKIDFNPKKLVKKKSEEKISLDEEIKLDGEFVKRFIIDKKLKDDYDKKFSAFVSAGNNPDDFKYDMKAYMHDLDKLIIENTNERFKLFLTVLKLNLLQYEVDGIDSSLFVKTLNTVNFDSYLWQLKPYVLTKAFEFLSDEERYIYANKVIENQKDENLKLTVIVNEFINAKLTNNEPHQIYYYEKLLNKFENTPTADVIKAQFSPYRNVKVGALIPEFSFQSLFDSTKFYSKESQLGKIYLLDFWALWCKPCVFERRYLEEANNIFMEKGLEIISISLDKNREDALKFINVNPTEIKNIAFSQEGFYSTTTKNLEISIIPKPILVDSKGNIIAIEEQLRGRSLIKTLEKFLISN